MSQTQLYIRMVIILSANVTCILLSFRRGFRENLRMVLACAVVLILSQIYRVLTGDPVGLLGFMPGFIFLPTLYFIHKGSFAQKVFVTFTVLSISYLILIGSSFFAAGSVTLRLVLLGSALAVYTAFVARRGHWFIQRVFDSAGGSWRGYAVYISVFYLLLTQAYPIYTLPPPEPDVFYYLLPVFAFAGLMLFFFAILQTREKTKSSLELDFARRTLNNGRDYYKNLTDTLERVKLMQHDYRHQLAVLSGLAHDGERREESLRHLDSMISRYETQEAESYTANPVIDALLNNYAAQIKAAGISFAAEVKLPEETDVDNYDLCIVLGNLLNNALAAVKNVNDGERYINLDVRNKNSQLVIRVSNNYGGEIKRDERGRVLSARDGGGGGSRSIRAVAQKYNGVYENEWDGGVFNAYVLLVVN